MLSFPLRISSRMRLRSASARATRIWIIQAFCTEPVTREPDTGAFQSYGIHDFYKLDSSSLPVIWKPLIDFM